ncbi:hypothetical protein QR680_017025 [Steinernema hermaphroditum]|uniref:Battenin n=1 Tax=Steinernema hermaphroditum TaxID=289476 RepID=A0AA39LMX1_9BILA|nr:hypothetical protein QR680_017025 [Steinernema hermaphroditum]
MAIEKKDEERSRVRNLIGYWFLGLCNNFAYIVMLAAAADILDGATSFDDRESAFRANGTALHCIASLRDQKCSPISTGAILLADILPTLIVKTTAPFLIRRVPFGVRHLFIIAGQLIAFVIVSQSTDIVMGLTGVVVASIAVGFGDITYLPLASHFPSYVISTWSSGTGASGLIGSTTYTVLTDSTLGGLSPRTALLMMTAVPILFAVVFWGVLEKPETVHQVDLFAPSTYLVPQDCTPRKVAPCPERPEPIPAKKTSRTDFSLSDKLVMIKPLLKYMVPLAVVYFAEYFINQGLMELVVFDCATGLGMSPRRQYRWYQVLYQIGVFLSRTSISLFLLPIKMLPVLAILQVANAVFFSFEATNRFIPNILIVFGIVLFEGFLGGWSYANTFNAIHTTSTPETREFSMGFATLADAIGIAIAGTLAIPTHNAICTHVIHH